MKCNHRIRRVGFSLIETMLAVTLGSVVMVMAVGLVHRGMVHHADTQSRVEISHAFNRFTESFQRDVHGATQVQIANNNLMLVNEGGESIRYFANGSQLNCERTLNNAKHSEQVELAPDQTVEFAWSESPQLCSLELRATASDTTTRTLRRIVVAVGLNCADRQPTVSVEGETP